MTVHNGYNDTWNQERCVGPHERVPKQKMEENDVKSGKATHDHYEEVGS